MDARGTIIASNGKLDQLFNQPLEELVGRDAARFETLLTERLTSSMDLQAWMEALRSNPGEPCRLAAQVKGEPPMDVLLQSIPMKSESDAIIGRIWVLEDRSKICHLERQLRESQKMGTLSLIAGGIAHDFNTDS